MKNPFENNRVEKMILEQKAKAYDKALECIQEILNSGSDSIKMSRLKLRLQPFFHELAESEDEKIRKELIAWLQNTEGQVLPIDRYDAALAWLEKQNEQDKPTYTTYSEDVQLTQEEYDKRRVSDEATIKEVEAYKKGLEDAQKIFEKQGEQKPINEDAEKEKTEYVSGQFLYCKGSFNEFKEGESYWLEYIGNDTYVGRSDNILNQKFHITPRQLYTWLDPRHPEDSNKCEQKPIKWSEEDEGMSCLLENMIHHNQDFSSDTKQQILEWLKSLKQRIGG